MNIGCTEIISSFDVNEDIVIPEGISHIRDNAFQGVYFFNSITFPKSLRFFSGNILDEEAEIRHIYIPSGCFNFYSTLLSKHVDAIEER